MKNCAKTKNSNNNNKNELSQKQCKTAVHNKGAGAVNHGTMPERFSTRLHMCIIFQSSTLHKRICTWRRGKPANTRRYLFAQMYIYVQMRCMFVCLYVGMQVCVCGVPDCRGDCAAARLAFCNCVKNQPPSATAMPSRGPTLVTHSSQPLAANRQQSAVSKQRVRLHAWLGATERTFLFLCFIHYLWAFIMLWRFLFFQRNFNAKRTNTHIHQPIYIQAYISFVTYVLFCVLLLLWIYQNMK